MSPWKVPAIDAAVARIAGVRADLRVDFRMPFRLAGLLARAAAARVVLRVLLRAVLRGDLALARVVVRLRLVVLAEAFLRRVVDFFTALGLLALARRVRLRAAFFVGRAVRDLVLLDVLFVGMISNS